jgi:hypothetical protein
MGLSMHSNLNSLLSNIPHFTYVLKVTCFDLYVLTNPIQFSVTRNWILDDIYESWNTQPVIVGSDSECDESDQLFSDMNSSAADSLTTSSQVP